MVIVAGNSTNSNWTAIGAVVEFITIYVVSLVAASILTMWIPPQIYLTLYPNIMPEEQPWAVYTTNWLVWIIALLWMMAARATSKGHFSEVFLFTRPVGKLSTAVTNALVLAVVIYLGGLLIGYFFPDGFRQDEEIFGYLLFSDFKWPMIVAMILLGPFYEEVMFRGLLFPAVSASALGATGSAILTSSIWSLIHFYSLAGSLFVFLIGLALCYLRYSFKSLWPCLGMHSLLNLANVVYISLIQTPA
jgi:membrane protease YdiL (CAAX protease family)